jgi:competence protein ComEA
MMQKGLQEKLVLGFLALLLVGGGFWRVVEHKNVDTGLLQAGFSRQQPGDQEVETATIDLITVHLVGAVVSPGVYHLPAGSRVFELLELGGGFTEEADQEGLNQARPLLDGEQVFVGLKGEISRSAGNSSAGEGKVNINKASVTELQTLPGIGEVKARQIIEYRDKNGFFTDPRELMDVSGIGEKTYSSLADLITIY